MLYTKYRVEVVLDSLLKSVLKRQMPYLIGGTITGTIMAYYYGFLFTIVVNSIIWFAISSLFNKYYWRYTGFKEEFQLASKYTGQIKKRNSKNSFVTKAYKSAKGVSVSNYPTSIEESNSKEVDNLGGPLKF